MTSASVKSAFAAAGIVVRVRNFKRTFRVCPVASVDFDQAAVVAVAKSLGFTDPLGRPGALFNTNREAICYKPGAIIRI
jgi:hypothetical protein